MRMVTKLRLTAGAILTVIAAAGIALLVGLYDPARERVHVPYEGGPEWLIEEGVLGE